MKLRFYKEIYENEHTEKWFVDLPTWEGPKEALEMVCGADTMLNRMDLGAGEVTLKISAIDFEGADELNMVREATEIGDGAFYLLGEYLGEEINLGMWLCGVTTYVFGYYPEVIFLKVIE